jgi:hypothetical protein
MAKTPEKYIGNCKLCNEEEELIQRSHLFPNFMYDGIPDEKNRMFQLSSETPGKIKTAQSGAYEEYILCKECDNNLLSKYERYASNNFYRLDYRSDNENFKQIVNENGVALIQCNNLVYKDFKIFLISLLWRVSISSHALFSNFKLDPESEEFLRQSIINEEPPNFLEFSCVMLTYQNEESVEKDLVAIKSTSQDKVTFYINEFIYTFYLDSSSLDGVVNMVTLNLSNQMAVMKAPNNSWAEIRKSIFDTLAKKTIK